MQIGRNQHNGNENENNRYESEYRSGNEYGVKPAAEKKTKATAAKKEAKAPAKKPAVKADAPVKEAVKESVYLQYNGIEAETQELTERAKQHWADAGNDLKDMKSIAIYVNANEMMVYYVVNDTEKGQFSLA